MEFTTLILIAVGLSMDAFAVSVCKGLGMRRLNYRQLLLIALFFGGFQGLMPLLGWLLGTQFEQYITGVDHFIVFGLLALIGGKMLWEAAKEEWEQRRARTSGKPTTGCGCPASSDDLKLKELVVLAIATSIDALAVGISLAFLQADIWTAVVAIGVITFGLSAVGVWVGHRFGARYKSKAELVGGAVLILIGLKILLEHLGWLG